MPTYKVKENNQVERTRDVIYKTGDTLELTEEEAAVIAHAVEPVEKEPKEKGKK